MTRFYYGTDAKTSAQILKEGLKEGGQVHVSIFLEDALMRGPVVLQMDLEPEDRVYAPEELGVVLNRAVPPSRIKIMSKCAGCGRPVDPAVITCRFCADGLEAQMRGTKRREG